MLCLSCRVALCSTLVISYLRQFKSKLNKSTLNFPFLGHTRYISSAQLPHVAGGCHVRWHGSRIFYPCGWLSQCCSGVEDPAGKSLSLVPWLCSPWLFPSGCPWTEQTSQSEDRMDMVWEALCWRPSADRLTSLRGGHPSRGHFLATQD